MEQNPPTTAVTFTDEQLRKIAEHVAYLLRPLLEDVIRDIMAERIPRPIPTPAPKTVFANAFQPARPHPVSVEGPACVVPEK